MRNKQSKMKLFNQTPMVRCLMTAGSLAVLGSGFTALGGGADNRAPEVPTQIAVPAGNKVHFHGYGVGVQIYTWNGTSWGTATPEATLFDHEAVVAIHFAGPTWESNSGSRVVGAVMPPPVVVDSNAIPWLLLKAVHTNGPGIFADTSYIQRVHTAGGKAPSANGLVVGQVARVPYTADYFFYRRTDD
jgi:hypothetical protein